MSLMSADALLEALDPEQRAVAEALRGPVRVLAGAGTGKTRAITHRIAYGVATGVYVPQQVLAVTFTTRAAGEMRQRLRTLGAAGVQARTFHSAALRQARYFWPRVYSGALPELMESKLGLVGRAASRNRVDTSPATLRDVAGEIEWSKVSNVRPEDYERVAEARGREISVPAATVARVFSSYEDLKREAGRMDMEDVLLCAAAVISEDERVAAEIRRQYAHFVVDEFQDVSPIQSTLLDLWLGGRHDLCVVGDPAQTIYSFAGASARHLLEFPQRHPGTSSVELVRNYRSTPQVVAAANAVMRASGRPTADRTSVQLRAQRPAGPEVTFAEQPDEVASGGCSTPVPRPTRSRSSCASTLSPRRSRRPWPARACPTSSAAPSASSGGPRCGRRSPCCAAAPGPARARVRPGTTWSSRPARCSAAWGSATRPPPRAATSATGGSPSTRC
jgi:DNA helicase-2/ATP-dependent DNA helicase PcrA